MPPVKQLSLLHSFIVVSPIPLVAVPVSLFFLDNRAFYPMFISFSISCSHQMFLTVYLSNNDQHFTEVPITPETLCRDVVELCKEPGETDCHLSEMWRGSGNLVFLLTNSPQWCIYFQLLTIFNCGILLHFSGTVFILMPRKLPFFFFFSKKIIYGD